MKTLCGKYSLVMFSKSDLQKSKENRTSLKFQAGENRFDFSFDEFMKLCGENDISGNKHYYSAIVENKQ